jgi:hypothetical protein
MKAEFRIAKRQRDVGRNGAWIDVPGIGVKARGDVDREQGAAPHFQRFQRRGDNAVQRPAATDAEDGIYYCIGAGDGRLQLGERLLVCQEREIEI